MNAPVRAPRVASDRFAALRDARAQRPDLPRDAFVKAGRIRRLEFNPSLRCDTLAVISWAEWAAKGGR